MTLSWEAVLWDATLWLPVAFLLLSLCSNPISTTPGKKRETHYLTLSLFSPLYVSLSLSGSHTSTKKSANACTKARLKQPSLFATKAQIKNERVQTVIQKSAAVPCGVWIGFWGGCLDRSLLHLLAPWIPLSSSGSRRRGGRRLNIDRLQRCLRQCSISLHLLEP